MPFLLSERTIYRARVEIRSAGRMESFHRFTRSRNNPGLLERVPFAGRPVEYVIVVVVATIIDSSILPRARRDSSTLSRRDGSRAKLNFLRRSFSPPRIPPNWKIFRLPCELISAPRRAQAQKEYTSCTLPCILRHAKKSACFRWIKVAFRNRRENRACRVFTKELYSRLYPAKLTKNNNII